METDNICLFAKKPNKNKNKTKNPPKNQTIKFSLFTEIELEVIDSCAINNGGCAHKCSHGNDGAICRCRKGYFLQADEKSCAGN